MTGVVPEGAVACGSATTVIWSGPTRSGRGVTTIRADGSSRYAPTPPTSTARARIAPPMSHGVRVPPRPLEPVIVPLPTALPVRAIGPTG